MKKLTNIFFLILIFILSFTTILGADGDLDPTFGRVGFGTQAFTGVDRASKIIPLADGKFLVVGSDSFTFGPIITLVKYNADGSLDTSFDNDGIVQISNGHAFDATIQSDGKIVVVGTYQETNTPFFSVSRFNPDGSLDTTFAENGIFTDETAGVANAVALKSDGKIVAAGTGRDAFFRLNYSVVQLNSNGTPDTSFDKDGKILTGVRASTPGSSDEGNAVAVQSDGKILVGGESRFFTVLRYNLDGSLDTTFDDDGIAEADFSGSIPEGSRLNALAIDQDGKIVATGFAKNDEISGLGVARFNSDGSLDTTFSDDGLLITDNNSEGFDIAVQNDRKLLIGGVGSTVTGLEFMLLRLNPNGNSDNSFGNKGKVFTQIFDGGSSNIQSVSLAEDGKIFAAGYAGKAPPSNDQDFAFAIYNPDGTPSSSIGTFGHDTQNILNEPNRSSLAEASATQADGKIIVVGGQEINDDESYSVLIRYRANGRLDKSFASSSTTGTGFLTVRPGNSNTSNLSDVVIQPDGKILAVGSYEGDSDAGLFLVRLNPDGEKDLPFGGNNSGVSTVGVLSGGAFGRSLKLLPDGKILVAGASVNIINQTIRFAVFKFNSDGSLDTSFGTNGIATTFFSPSNDIALSLDIQESDGKIIASGGGNFDLGSNGNIAIARFNTDGSIDTSFGTNGRVTDDVGGFVDLAADLKIQKDGKFIIGGASCTDGNCDGGRGFIFRYNSNGSADSTFNVNGRVFIPSSSQGLSTGISGVAVQENGKILGGGVIQNPSTSTDALLTRYNSDGSIDTEFGTNGIVGSDIENTEQISSSIDLQSDGKVVSVGSSQEGSRTDFSIWRYIVSDSSTSPSNNTLFDFDGDGKTDISIFRPNVGEWWYLRSSDLDNRALQFGSSTDVPTPADFTGDGKTDISFFRNGEWFVLRSEDDSFFSFPWGQAGDVPAPGDFDGDGKADPTVFRPADSTWFILKSTGGADIIPFGIAEDKPVIADYDGDGKDDIAIFRPSVSEWWINQSTDGVTALQFGSAGDRTVQGDYTGDGKADVAFFRPTTGEWFIIRSEDFSFFSFPFGTTNDIPTPGDYDGDGVMDTAVFRPSSTTWFLNTTSNGVQIIGFGSNGDIPIPSVYSVSQ